MALKPINIRQMWQHDLEAVLRCERMSHAVRFEIPELPQLGEIESLQPWAWREKDILKAVRQYRQKEVCQYDTRCIVAEVPVWVIDGKDGPQEQYAVVGGCIYEIQENGYEILLLTSQPFLSIAGVPHDGPTAVRHSLLEYMLTKAEKSDKRHKVSIYIPDGDWSTLKFFRSSLGWAAKLHPYFYADGNDAWYCEYQAVVSEKTPIDQVKS